MLLRRHSVASHKSKPGKDNKEAARFTYTCTSRTLCVGDIAQTLVSNQPNRHPMRHTFHPISWSSISCVSSRSTLPIDPRSFVKSSSIFPSLLLPIVWHDIGHGIRGSLPDQFNSRERKRRKGQHSHSSTPFNSRQSLLLGRIVVYCIRIVIPTLYTTT